MSDFKEYIQKKVMIDSIVRGVLSKFPLLGTSMVGVKYIVDNEAKTAYTNGKDVYFNEEFVSRLNYEQRVFVFAHEIMHIAFDHIRRTKGKDDHKLWNIATDAVINQLLQGEGLQIMDGLVDIEEAIGKSAEYMYNLLLKKKEEMQEQFEKFLDDIDKGQESESSAGDHTDWESFADEMTKEESNESDRSQDGSSEKNTESESINESNSFDNGEENQSSQGKDDFDEENSQEGAVDSSSFEEEFSQRNREKKKELGDASRRRAKVKKNRADESANNSLRGGFTSSFNGVGESESVVSWKKLLRREIESEEEKWSYRRASEDNDWQARIGSMPSYEGVETEVMLDVSGSVSDAFLRGFLRQLKPILRESKLRVGCFDEFVYKFIDIKKVSDIDTFSIVRTSTWTENWDAAVRAFSKKREVNKIVFTDGNPCPGVMPKEDLKKVNVIWLVFDNKEFKPCCGKVIYIDRNALLLLNDDQNPQDGYER